MERRGRAVGNSSALTAGKKSSMSKSFEKSAFVASVSFLSLLLIFVYGVAVGRYKIWPFHIFVAIQDVAQSLTATGKIVPDKHLYKAPVHASMQPITIHNSDLMIHGYYVFVVWDGTLDQYAAWLFDSHGEHLHTWTIDYDALDPDGSPPNATVTPHGFKVLPDGSLIVNFDQGNIMARLDVCGQPIWTKTGAFHHSLERAEDGSFWTWRGQGSAYGHYQYIVNFDPESGSTIKELDLVNDVIKPMGPAASTVFGVRPDFQFIKIKQPDGSDLQYDIFHPNDIDVLHSVMAENFPYFEAGYLLLSFRTLHLVAVLDPNNVQLKWWSHGPWRFQHDPDFTIDGKISVYNNNPPMDRSEIIKIDPVTREISNDLYDGDLDFFTEWMGKHQYLPNGNVLIVVPEEGRIIEVSPQGQKALEFNNIASDGYNWIVPNGLWIATNFFEKFPECLRTIQ